MCDVDSQGRCAKHNFVQVKRMSRTGEWKSLLEACPLCVMDTPGAKSGDSSALVVASPASSDEEKKSFRVSFSQETTGHEVRKDYQFRLPSSSSLQCIDASDRSIVSVGSTQSATRSALKSPKYKVCPKMMKEQRNLEVTTMSMDLDIEEDSESEDEISQQQPPLPPKQPKRTPPPPPRRQSRHKEQKSKVNTRMIGKSPVRSSIRRSATSSSVNSNDSMHQEQVRPDPSAFNQALVCTEIHEPNEDQFTCGQGPFIMTRDVSDDVSAISFMGSVYSNQQPNNFNTLVPFQEEEEEPQDDDFDFDNDEETICTSTNNYDSKGRCVTHPHVRLRKKKFLGRGWKVLMSACPDCCVDELRRLHARKKSINTQKANKVMPRSSIKDKDSDDTASLSSSSQGSNNGKQLSVVKKQDDGVFVKNMAWTDSKGRRGSYTGEVDNQFIPNGKGTMQYEDSKVKEGEWKDGRKSSSGRSRARASERSSRSRSVSVRPGARSRSTSVTPRTRARSSSRARVTPEF